MTAKRTTQSVTVTVDRELINRARDADLKNMQQHVGVKRTQKLSLR